MSRILDKIDRKHRLGFLLLLSVAIVGVLVILVQTRYGLGTTGDSVRYIMGAESLLEGNGYSRTSGGGEIRPITMFPPFYSVVLAGVKITGLDLYDGARILQALLFGLNIFLVGLLIFRYTRSAWAALMGSLFILVAMELVFYHTWVLTEAVFITLMLVFILGLIQFLDRRNVYLLIVLGILVGAATMTRYVGLSLIMAGALSILVLSEADWKQRLLDCFVLGGISVAPVLLWLRRNSTLTGTSVNRSFVYHPMSTELIQAYRAEISYWFVPKLLDFPHTIRKALMLLIGIPGPLLFFLLQLKENFLKRDLPRKPFWTLPWILVFFVLSYVGLLFFNLTLLDAISDFNTVPRYLVPVYIAAVILFIIVFHRLTILGGMGKILRGAAVALGFSLMVL
jgi:4-amino-4-deoxy-L-arabinose transferase-like glycosyltransferase